MDKESWDGMVNETKRIIKKAKMEKKIKELDERMYRLNAKLSALIHIQKLKTKEEAEMILSKINREIAEWIKQLREIYNEIEKETNRKNEENG